MFIIMFDNSFSEIITDAVYKFHSGSSKIAVPLPSAYRSCIMPVNPPASSVLSNEHSFEPTSCHPLAILHIK